MSLGLRKPCLECGEPTTNESRCTQHEQALAQRLKRASDRRRVATRPSNAEQGRDTAWRRLSERARKMQPWCSDCSSTEDLTADHSPEAWHRRLVLHLPIRLQDVDVVCRSCNNKRGPAQPGSERYEAWLSEVQHG